MTLSVWLGFLLAAILIAVTPGPGAVISMSTGVRLGYPAAFAVILGLQLALLLQLLVVALGLGALLAASETAFSAIKFLGAGYLCWLGVQRWRAEVTTVAPVLSVIRQRNLFVQGLLVNLTNPKAIIFIGALVPQFVDPALPQVAQYAQIAATLCLTDMIVMSGYALMAERFGRWLRDPHSMRLQNRVFGGLFVSAGALLAISSRSV